MAEGCSGSTAIEPNAVVRTGDVPKDLLDSESLPKYKRDLVAKQKVLRAELQALQPQSGHCRLEVSRTEIFEVSPHRMLYTIVDLFSALYFLNSLELLLYIHEILLVNDESWTHSPLVSC